MPVITEQFTNFASSTVYGGAGGAGSFLNAGDLSLVLSPGDGAKFPSTANGTWKLLVGDPLGANEIVLVTTRATDTLTIVRNQEGTSANTWAYGTPVQAAVTAGSMQTLYNRITGLEYNVLDYGALGDGVTDNTTFIQNAINAAGTAGQIAAPSAPGATGNTGVGSSFTAGQTCNVALTWNTPRGETVCSANTLVTITTNANNIVVTIPAFPAGVTFAGVYASIANGSATLASAGFPGAPGTFTITAFPAASTIPGRTVNTTGQGGTIRFPPGIYSTGTLVLLPFVHLEGAGTDSTIIRLKAGVNADLFNGGATNLTLLNVANTTFTNGSAMDIPNWSMHALTLDGNKGGQASGPSYVIRMYAHGYVLDNVRVRNGYSGGIYVDFNGPDPAPDQIVTMWNNVEVHDCGLGQNGVGIVWGGPTDSVWEQVVCYNTGSHCVYGGPHASNLQMTNCHMWSPGSGNNSAVLLIEGDGWQLATSQYETSDTVQIALLADFLMMSSCHLYNAGAGTPIAIQFGQTAGLTPYNLSIYQGAGVTTAKLSFGNIIDCKVDACTSANGAFRMMNEGATQLHAMVVQSSGSVFGSSTPGAGDTIDINTSNMTAGVAGSYGLHLFSDFVAVQASSSYQAIATGNTITTIGVGTLARCSVAAASTGVILQAGAYQGQIVIVENSSGANSITFAAYVTSHVLDGVADVIAPNTSRMFVWDTGIPGWSRLG